MKYKLQGDEEARTTILTSVYPVGIPPSTCFFSLKIKLSFCQAAFKEFVSDYISDILFLVTMSPCSLLLLTFPLVILRDILAPFDQAQF